MILSHHQRLQPEVSVFLLWRRTVTLEMMKVQAATIFSSRHFRYKTVRYPANFYASSSSIETWLESDSIRANRARH